MRRPMVVQTRSWCQCRVPPGTGNVEPLDIRMDSTSNIAMLENALIIITGYLAGSLSTAVIVCRLMNLGDPRLKGSCNPGATNVLRLYGRKAAMLALGGDLAKGMLPVLLARYLGAADAVVALTGLAAFAGHLYPVFFGFRGGKGVATLLGVVIATSWIIAVLFAGTWLLVAGLFRYSSLASLTSALLIPLYAALLLPGDAYEICFSVMVAMLILRHRGNIRKLISGTESKIGKRDGMMEDGDSGLGTGK